MALYKQKINPRTGQFNLVPTNNVITWKPGVAAQANLPLTGNTLYDGRMTNDTQHLYLWTKDAPTGLLTDWVDQGDIVDLTWAAISGKPSSLVTDIDDAVSKRHTQNSDTYLATQVKNVLYVDGNRTDTYTANGSITKPFKKIQDAIDAIVSPSATNKHLIEIAPGAYYTDAITINKVYTTFRSCGLQGARISGKITVENPSSPTPHQITFVGLRISGGLECLASHTAINCVDCNVTGSAWVFNPASPTDDEYLQVWGGLWSADVTLTNVYAYLMGGGYYSTFVATNKEFNINNADINTPFSVTLNGTVVASAYGDRAGSSVFVLNTGATLYIDADTEGGSTVTVNSGATLVRTTKAANIKNVPAGNIAATDVQAALNELDSEKTTLSAVKGDSDVADALTKRHAALGQFNQATAGEIAGLTDKALPVDADVTLIEDSETTPTPNAKKKLTWANIKSTLKTYFDTIYTLANLGGVPTSRTVNGHALTSDVTVTKGDVTLGNVDNKSEATIITDVKADVAVADALTKRHTQGTDTTLGAMTANLDMNNRSIVNLASESISFYGGGSIKKTDYDDAITKKHTADTDTIIKSLEYSSDFLTGGTATADSTAEGGNEPSKACDNNMSTRWLCVYTPFPHWWKYDLGAGVTKIARKMTITTNPYSEYMKDFKLQGSNDNSIWTDIYTGQHANNNDLQTFYFSNTISYRYYRLYMTSNWGGDAGDYYVLIYEIELMETTTIDLINNGSLKQDLLVIAGKTIDGRDVSIDGEKIDGVQLANIIFNICLTVKYIGTTFQQIVNGIVDALKDENGLDLINSTGFVYDGVNDLITTTAPIIDVNTKLLLHCNGDDGSTIFTDECENIMTANFDAKIKQDQKKFGSASGYFDGTDDSVTTPATSDFAFGAGDFTVDYWVRHKTVATWYYYYFDLMDGYSGTGICVRWSGFAHLLQLFIGGTFYSSASWTPTANIWYHMAVVRTSGKIKIFINGTQLGTDISDSYSISVSSGDEVKIGNAISVDLTLGMYGWIDEFRISNNARWITDFFVPTSEYGAISDNILLLSNQFLAESVPTKGKLVIFEEDIDAITLNTDLKGYISNDDGSNWIETTLVDKGDYATGKRIIESNLVTLTPGVSNNKMKYKLTTANLKRLNLHGVSANWQ
jgi:hypothetical protein